MKVERYRLAEQAVMPATKTHVTLLPKQTALTILLGIIGIATFLRIGSALYQGNLVTALPGIYDQLAYDHLAQRLLTGHGFSFAYGYWPATRPDEPTAHWSYLYILYLTSVYGLFGTTPVVARLLQALIAGLLHSWLAWRVGRRLFGETTALVAAALNALYIYFFYYAGALITETFYILGILWTFDVALRLVTSEPARATDAPTSVARPWRLWAELGLAVGVTVLLRQLFLLFVPFLFLWLWWNSARRPATLPGERSWPLRFDGPLLKGLAGATLIITLLIIPWTIRNYRAFDALVPLNTNAGYAFFWGNHPIYGSRFVGILPVDGPSYLDLIPEELRQLDEAALDRALLQRGIGFVLDDPVRYGWLSLSRTREYFKFWPSAESGLISNIARVGSFGLALPWMLYGLLLSFGRLRRPDQPQQRSALVLCYLFILVYTGIHLLSWALIRYRLPVDAILLFFAAYGVTTLGQRFIRSRSITPFITT